MAKPEWWNDEGLKALSARVVRSVPGEGLAFQMRAMVLSGLSGGKWEVGYRSAAELKEAVTHYDRAARLSGPAMKEVLTARVFFCHTVWLQKLVASAWLRHKSRRAVQDHASNANEGQPGIARQCQLQ